MSKSEKIDIEHEALEVIRLKVDGVGSFVNTIRDQQTARGLSLVCPFPALEAEIPVSFSAGKEQALQRGTIHRIGVEDDPESGLPRLRLSIRADDGRSTIISTPDQELLDESSSVSEDTDARAATDIDVLSTIESVTNDEYSIADEELFKGQSNSQPPSQGSEPAWIGCDELPLPAELMDQMRTRRRRKLTGVTTWVSVLVLAAVGGYFLVRAGVVDIDTVRDHIAGMIRDRTAAIDAAEATVSPGKAQLGTDTIDLAGNPVAIPSEQTDDGSYSEMDDASIPEIPSSSSEAVIASADSSSPAAPAIVEASHPSYPTSSTDQADAEDSSASSQTDVTILLPTRWRAEYANAYRLRDPNGVVVDVPGGLVRREGWLDEGKNHPMIRSIKAVQRETGARFVVFIHGDLPRFVTSPKPGGVALRLFHESTDEPPVVEKIASLE